MKMLSFYRISLNTMTLTIESPTVYTRLGVAISVTGIAQVSRMSLNRKINAKNSLKIKIV